MYANFTYKKILIKKILLHTTAVTRNMRNMVNSHLSSVRKSILAKNKQLQRSATECVSKNITKE